MYGAIAASVVAALDGFVMVSTFTPIMVLIEMLLVACATLQWTLYFNIKTRLELHAFVNQDEKA
jgi:hypothetical protein